MVVILVRILPRQTEATESEGDYPPVPVGLGFSYREEHAQIQKQFEPFLKSQTKCTQILGLLSSLIRYPYHVGFLYRSMELNEALASVGWLFYVTPSFHI